MTQPGGEAIDPAERYHLAQLAARGGDLQRALTLIDEAQAGFNGLHDSEGAARCDAGRSLVLQDLGEFRDAATAARRWVEWVEVNGTDPRLRAQAFSNLATCLHASGDYLDAEAAVNEATNASRSAQDDELLASVEVNRATILNALGRGPAALVSLTAAIAMLEPVGGDALVAALINAGETVCSMGRPDDGLTWFARAERLVEPRSELQVSVLIESAAALDALGAVDEAERRYREALDIVQHLPLAWLEGRAWRGYGSCLRRLGSTQLAADAFRSASRQFLAANSVAEYALCEAEALALVDKPDRSSEVRDLVRLIDDLHEGASPVHACEIRSRLALVLDPVGAELQLRQAHRLAVQVVIPHLIARTATQLAAVVAGQGRYPEARELATEALQVAETIRRRLDHDRIAAAFSDTIVDAWGVLVEVQVAVGELEAALESSDAARSSSLTTVEAWSDSAPVDEDRLGLQAELISLYRRLCDRSPTMNRRDRGNLDARAREIERDIDRIDLAGDRFQGDDATVRLLPEPDEAQAVFHIRGSEISLFVRTIRGTRFYPDLMSVADAARLLEEFHAAGRRALATARVRGESVPPELCDSSERRLAVLGRMLIGRAADELHDDVTSLTVIPQGLLHSVPFSALSTANGVLLERFDVCLAPSLRVRASRPLPNPAGHSVLVGFNDGSLPHVDEELDELVALVPDATVLRGAAATTDAIALAAHGAKYLHIASHGIFRSGAPSQSGILTVDGWLTVEAISRLRLSGATVVLSACDTGCSVSTSGDELLGMQRGFFQAGARTVVMSGWATIDHVSRSVAVDTHVGLQSGLTASAALRAAVNAQRGRTHHPWWWAPFFVTGAG